MLFILILTFVSCPPSAEDDGDAGDSGDAGDAGWWWDTTIIWEDDFETGELADEWWNEPTDSGELTVTDDEKFEGMYSAKAYSQELNDDSYYGSQITVDVNSINYYQERVDFYYNADSVGEALFGIWDMDVATIPAWTYNGNTEGWNEKRYLLKLNSGNIWIGIVGGNDDDKVYVDHVRVTGDTSVLSPPSDTNLD